MCLVIHIATDHLIATPPWDSAATPLVVRELPGAHAVALSAFSKPRVYSVGVSGDWGCRFQCPDGGARRALVRLLECALASDPEVELFACWEGEEDRDRRPRTPRGPAGGVERLPTLLSRLVGRVVAAGGS